MLENKIRTPEEVEAYLHELREWIAGEEEAAAEEMSAFFTKRLAHYEDVHLGNWGELYAHIADFFDGGLETLLDIGCGTGLELEAYFRQGGAATVTGIDLSADMLDALRQKRPGQRLTLVQGSYFTLPLGEGRYDAAVSVESLHHFPARQKADLYRRLCCALKPGGYFVLTDYFAASDAQEAQYFADLQQLKAAQGLPDGAFYHYDTPLTVAHETEALQGAGFATVEDLCHWGATHTLRAAR